MNVTETNADKPPVIAKEQDRRGLCTRRQVLAWASALGIAGCAGHRERRLPTRDTPPPVDPRPPATPLGTCWVLADPRPPYKDPSLVYPHWHSLLIEPWHGCAGNRDHRLTVPSSAPNAAGAQIVELRGWLRSIHPGPNRSEGWTVGGVSHRLPNDWTFEVELDPRWTDEHDIELHALMRIGSIILHDMTGDTFAAVALPMIRVEMMAWDPCVTIPGDQAGAWNFDCSGLPTPVPDPGWVFRDEWPNIEPVPKNTFWPWDPRCPSNDPQRRLVAVGIDEERTTGKRPDYVRIVGALVTDDPHRDPALEAWGRETNLNHAGNPARWTEVHPPDRIEVLPYREPLESVRCVAIMAKLMGKSLHAEILSPGPSPDPLCTLKCVESINPDSNRDTIVFGNSTKTGAAIQRIFRPDGSATVTLDITIEGYLRGGTFERYGQFTAIYRVFWELSDPHIALAAFFTSESIALARLGGYSNSTRNAVDQSVHRDWALGQNASVVVADLLEKYIDQFYHQQRSAGPFVISAPAEFFADCAVRWARYGLTFPNAAEITANSTDRTEHLRWAQQMIRGGPHWTGIGTVLSEIRTRVQMLCDEFTSVHGTWPFLQALFAWESSYLAERGGYSVPEWNEKDPRAQLARARRIRNATALRDELVQKYNEQLDLIDRNTPSELPRFYADVNTRLNAYGIDFGSQEANSLDPALHAAWAQSVGVGLVKAETERRLRDIFKQLTA